MSPHPDLPLNDGNSIPQLGLGVWRTPPERTAATVATALRAGYRLIDTAAIYGNEEGVGAGLAEAGADSPREDVFVTTKLWNTEHGYDATLRAFDASLQRLRLEYLDLFLVHWPSPGRDRYVDSWRAMIRLRDEGRVRSIGVSNFTIAHLTRLQQETGVTPVLNQVELHANWQQAALRAFHVEHAIVTQAWSPLGQGRLLADPTVGAIADRLGRTPAQVLIRWHIQIGNAVIPKSVDPARIAQNAAVFDFALDDDDLAALARLDRPDGRIGPDPDHAEF